VEKITICIFAQKVKGNKNEHNYLDHPVRALFNYKSNEAVLCRNKKMKLIFFQFPCKLI